MVKKEKKISDIRRALHFMIEAHDGVYRKFSGKEYAHHPVEVAKIVRRHKKSKNIEELIIAALLHDTVEDVDEITLDTIEVNFGKLVASIVSELTSDPEQIKIEGKALYLLNKMLNMTSYALNIKLADRLHNCSDLDKASHNFRRSYVRETRIIIDGIRQRDLTDPHLKLIDKIDNKISKFE